MKRILLFLFPLLLPYLASAQVAKDTVTVLTIAQIPAGEIRDTTNITFVQDNAFKKATFDSLYKYTRVKLLAASAITSAELANALSGETGTGAAVFATSPMLTTPNLGTPSAATLTNATGLPIATGLTGLGGINRIPYATSATALTTSAGLTFDGTNFATTGTASATKFIPTGGSATGNGMYLPATNKLALSTNSVNRFTIDENGVVLINTTTKPSVLGGGFFINRGNALHTPSYYIFGGSHASIMYGSEPGFTFSSGLGSAGTLENTEQAIAGMGILYISPTDYQNFRIGTQSDHKMFFLTNNSTRMTVDNDGDVGIGANNPQAQLHTTGSVRFATFAGGGTTTLSVDNAGDLLRTPSTIEYKKDIEPIRYGLKEVLALQPVNFNWIDEDRFGSVNENGFVAEDVMNVLPNVANADGNGVFMDYTKLIAVLTKAIQEQQTQIEVLKARITQLENK